MRCHAMLQADSTSASEAQQVRRQLSTHTAQWERWEASLAAQLEAIAQVEGGLPE